MAGRASETAYYLNGKLARLALIGKGVRFPGGLWIRVADGTLAVWQVERLVFDLFVALRPGPLRFAFLLTDFDVEEFEKPPGECAVRALRRQPVAALHVLHQLLDGRVHGAEQTRSAARAP